MIRKGIVLSLIPLLAIVAAGSWGYLVSDASGRFPVHWGLDGRPDRYAGPVTAFLALPLLAMTLAVLFATLPALDPFRANLLRSGPAYLTAWIGTLSLLALVQLGLTLSALENTAEVAERMLPRAMLVAVSLLVVALGCVTGKARRNWLVGVRTPWTLSSEVVWTETHRWFGPLFALAGAVSFIASLTLSLSAAILIVAIGVLGVTAFSVIHSYVLWRRSSGIV